VSAAADLPAEVARALDHLVAAAREALGDTLVSVVLYGSAAEGALRATSDVNVILVLTAFEPARIDRLREPLRVARAIAGVRAMFLLREELADAARAFAQKFADVRQRHRVLWGDDPFAALEVPRAALVLRLDQVLLNLTLRLRAFYVERSLREEQLVPVVADAAPPLRTSATALLALEGRPAASPKAALAEVARALGGADWDAVLARVSAARETRALPTGVAGPTLLALVDLTRGLRARVAALR
jgi:predicted nucleotidyltransferase